MCAIRSAPSVRRLGAGPRRVPLARTPTPGLPCWPSAARAPQSTRGGNRGRQLAGRRCGTCSSRCTSRTGRNHASADAVRQEEGVVLHGAHLARAEKVLSVHASSAGHGEGWEGGRLVEGSRTRVERVDAPQCGGRHAPHLRAEALTGPQEASTLNGPTPAQSRASHQLMAVGPTLYLVIHQSFPTPTVTLTLRCRNRSSVTLNTS